MASGKINATSVNLRQDPANDSQIQTVLVKDTVVDTMVPSADGMWTLLSATVGGILFVGWVQSQFITIGDVTPTGPSGGGDTKPVQDGTLLRGDGSFLFTAVVSGNDIVVSNVTSTWFGGTDDPNDNGRTASGLSTRDNPDLIGCALPMDGAGSPRTDGSPIPKLPYLTTKVSVTNRKNGMTLSVQLIDLGPAKPPASHHALDLTKAAFQALGGNPDDGVMRVDYTIIGGARHVPGSSGGSVGRNDTGGTVHDDRDPHHGQSHDVAKPLIKQFIPSPNFSSRNGTKIDMIVMHYTDGASAQGAINRFLDPREQVSAHYIIERNGDIFQMVNDSEKAWHAKTLANPRSIGIEHVALPGQHMAPDQQTSSVALVRWLVATYGIKTNNILGHRFSPGNVGTTDCPAELFGEATEDAVVDWVADHIV
jgi:N-acetylmuramoyl-L-alanine amidase